MKYFNIQHTSKGIYKERGSKFFSYIHCISSIEEFKQILNKHRVLNPKAVHVVNAFRIKNGQRIDEYASDDGEPKGSSGVPVLNSIKRNKLINVGVYVVRYFGGTKLGIPGLISSYKKSAEDAINKTKKLEFVNMARIKIAHHLSLCGIVDSTIAFYNGKIINREFNGTVLSVVSIFESNAQKFVNEIYEKTSGTVEVDC